VESFKRQIERAVMSFLFDHIAQFMRRYLWNIQGVGWGKVWDSKTGFVGSLVPVKEVDILVSEIPINKRGGTGLSAWTEIEQIIRFVQGVLDDNLIVCLEFKQLVGMVHNKSVLAFPINEFVVKEILKSSQQRVEVPGIVDVAYI
jgi:hypothetical protein